MSKLSMSTLKISRGKTHFSSSISSNLSKASGSGWCLCAGEVLFMCGHYGWLTTDSIIEHPSAGKNGARIYVHQRDVASGVTLVEGDKVVFYLYVDDQGR